MNPVEYERMAAVEHRHWWFLSRLAIVSAVLKRWVKAPARGLDCSCGTGLTLERLPQYVQFGADLSPLALAQSRKRNHPRLFCADLRRLPVADGALDLVTCLDTLEHIEHDAAAAGEIARVLRPGGHALITVPQHPWLFSGHDRALHHVRRYRRRELRELLTGAGLEIRRFTSINCALLPAVALKRWLDGKKEGSDTDRVPGALANIVFYAAFAPESLVVPRFNLPWGVSLLALARRPG